MVDVRLAVQLYRQDTNPARLRAQLPVTSAVEPAATSFADARARKALADAEAAEMNLAELKRELVGAAGVDKAADDLSAMIPQVLEDGLIDAVQQIRQAGTAGDATKLVKPIVQGLCARLIPQIHRAVRETVGDA